jgi:hypothetical protein
MIWTDVRDQMIDALSEAIGALNECTQPDHLMLVLEIIERYPDSARRDLRTTAPVNTPARIERMRAAVSAMRTRIELVDPLKSKDPAK